MRKILIISFLSLGLNLGAQQDPHFSMWQVSPSLLNPAATGAMQEDFSFLVNNRTQWLTAVPSPFITSSVAGEMRVGRNQLSSGWFGAGLQASQDNAGVTNTSTLAIGVPISYVLEVNRSSLFSVGLKPGIINRGQNASVQTWDNQWNGTAFDQTVLTGETKARNFNEFDMSAGLMYQTEFYDGSKFEIGGAMNHITRPNVTFREIINELYPQYLVHSKVNLHFDKVRFRLVPQITAFKQGPIDYLMVGSNLDLVLREGSKRTIFVSERLVTFGLHYRMSGWATVNFGMQLESFAFGLAYDAPITSSRQVTGIFGAGEIFLKYAFVNGEKKRKLR
ncbi:MAG: PorP/SprF family type IX secretion system membrane protein [Bacteroidetes bacterium]|nr:PorP/SprF family type IX secretion system membrane protein [Bacteroidota bacterium]